MSRRTKLILTATFLGLLTIPAVYVALTWFAPNPLRFRMVGYEDPSGEGLFVNSGKLSMVVENTSRVPVHLYGAILKKAGDPDQAVDAFGPFWELYMPEDRVFIVVPPHTSLPCFSVVPAKDDPASAFENIELSYHWMSASQYKADEARLWLFFRVPAMVRSCIPIDWPSHTLDTTPLQTAQTMP